MIGVVGALLLSLAMGACVVGLVWPCATWRSAIDFKLALAMTVGLGLSALSYYVSLQLRGTVDWHPIVFDFVMLAVLAAAVAARFSVARRNATDAQTPDAVADDALPPNPTASSNRIITAGLSVAMLATLVVSAMAFIQQYDNFPHGGWDAWANWNYRGRFIVQAGERWRDAFMFQDRAHHDYPLLLPATNARLWQYHGGALPTWIPALTSALFTLLTAGIIFGGLRHLRSLNQALLGALVFFAFPFLILHAAAQYAEAPLMCFAVAAIACVAAAYQHGRGGVGLWVVAGLCAGLAAWTKNEGLLFAVVITVAGATVALLADGWRPALARGWRFALGLAPLIAVVLYERSKATSSGHMIEQTFDADTSLAARVFDGERHFNILSSLWVRIVSHPENAIVLLLPMYAAMAGLDASRPRRPWMPIAFALAVVVYGAATYPSAAAITDQATRWGGWWTAALVAVGLAYTASEVVAWAKQPSARRTAGLSIIATAALLIAGYYAMYLITGQSLEVTPPTRLFTNCWPLIVFACLFVIRDPDAILKPSGE